MITEEIGAYLDDLLVCPCGDEAVRHDEDGGCSAYESGLESHPIYHACACRRTREEARRAAIFFVTSPAMRERLRDAALEAVCPRCRETTLYQNLGCSRHDVRMDGLATSA